MGIEINSLNLVVVALFQCWPKNGNRNKSYYAQSKAVYSYRTRHASYLLLPRTAPGHCPWHSRSYLLCFVWFR